MAWVELAVFGFILLLVAWVFLRPFPKDKLDPPIDSTTSSSEQNTSLQNERKDSDH